MKALGSYMLGFAIAAWCASAYGQPRSPSEPSLVGHVDSALAVLVRLQKEIVDIHPLLVILQPVAVVDGEEMYIFDVDSLHAGYTLVKKTPVPFPMEKGIRASFPLSTYGGKPTCVVTPEVFDDREGYATLFHEFIHCAQFQTVEPGLKQHLEIAQQAAKANNYSWEIMHAFPYQDSTFIERYGSFLKALQTGDRKGVDESLQALKRQLSKTDYEYMVWEEWKEGFARLIENKIRARLGVPPNQGGIERPYNRVTFYAGGELFIHFLVWHDEDLLTDMNELFARMLEGTD